MRAKQVIEIGSRGKVGEEGTGREWGCQSVERREEGTRGYGSENRGAIELPESMMDRGVHWLLVFGYWFCVHARASMVEEAREIGDGCGGVVIGVGGGLQIVFRQGLTGVRLIVTTGRRGWRLESTLRLRCRGGR